MNYGEYKDNSKTVERYASSMADKAIRFMSEIESGTRLFTSTGTNGDFNYQYLVKQPCGRIDQYTRFGNKKMDPPSEIDTPVPKAPTPSPDRNHANPNLQLTPLTQPNFDDGEVKEKDEEEKLEEKTVLATLIEEKSKDMPKPEFDSREEYEKAAEKTRNDEASNNDERWWSLGKCIHCGDTNLCHIYKYGPFCINIANATRQGNSKKERERLLVAFCEAYQYASQYRKYMKNPHDHQQIHADDLENLPHCTFRLMDNWLKAIKKASGAEKILENKRSNDNEDHDDKRSKRQRIVN